MAISSSTRKAGPYLGNDATTVFPFEFKVFEAADLMVVETDDLLIERVLELGPDYSVELHPNQDDDAGGSVILAAALPEDFKLTIGSNLPITQPLELTNAGGFYPRVINAALDRITIIAQQILEQLGRTLKLPFSTNFADATLPIPVANGLIGFNSGADGFTVINPMDLVTVAGYADARVQQFNGDGVQTDFVIDFNPGVLANLDISIGGVVQLAGVDFTWSGVTVVFTSPPYDGAVIQIRYARPIAPVPDFDAVLVAAASISAQAVKLDNIVDITAPPYNAVGDGTTNDRAAIQQALNDVNALGGGRVVLPRPAASYNLGTAGLTLYGNVVLEGQAGRYAGSTTRGVTLTYSGTGAAIFGENILDGQIVNLDIDCTGATGTSVRGIYLSGVWKTTLRNVTVRGVTPAKGYSILFDTVGTLDPWGAQHNYLEQVEVADGIIRLEGRSGSDGVTTTVFNTVRGYQYQVVHSQGVAINATAEGWASGPGWLFDGVGTNFTMVGCDIEGPGSPGIQITNSATVREIGTIWAGFSGAEKVSGAMATLRSYGGEFEFSASSLTANVPRLLATYSDRNATFVQDELVPTDVAGGTQEGHVRRTRKIGGANFITHDGSQETTPPVKVVSSGAASTPVTILSFPIPTADTGLNVEVSVCGFMPGEGRFMIRNTGHAVNTGAGLSVVSGTALSVGTSSQLSFTSSGDNLLARFNPGGSGATGLQVYCRVLGPYKGHT